MPHPPNRLNVIRLTRQETKTFAVFIRTSEGRVAKLQGANVVMSVRQGTTGPALIRKQLGDGIQIVDLAKGKALITLTSADTAALSQGTYRYDVWVTYPTDPPERRLVVKADMIVAESVTDFE